LLIEDGYVDNFDMKTLIRHNTVTMENNEYKIKKMTEKCKNRRLEQSDMVMILLNIAHIPDEVMIKMDFGDGWTIKLK